MLRKRFFLVIICAVASALFLLAGCGKQKTKSPAKPNPAAKAPETVKAVSRTVNKVINPSFEKAKVFTSGLYKQAKAPVEKPSGWTTKNQVLNDSIGWASDEAHTGTHSLKIENIGGTDAYWEGSPIVLKQDANAFTVDIWTKTKEDAVNEKAKFQVVLAVYFKGVDGRDVWGRQITVDINKTGNAWEKTSKKVLIAKKISRIVPYLYFSGATGTVWFDDLSIVPYLDKGKILFDSRVEAPFIGKVKVISGKDKNKIYRTTGSQQLMSTAFIPVDENKTYKLSGMFKSVKVASRLYFGFVPYDKEKKFIDNYSVRYRKNTETELTKKCSVNDKVIFIKDAAHWKKNPYACIAFNVDISGKYSDLPNFNRSSVGIRKISFDNNNGYWKIELAKACLRAYPAGTKIREHVSDGSGTYIYSAAKHVKVPGKWTEYKGIVDKSNKQLFKSFHPGTKYVKIFMLTNFQQSDDVSLDFKNIKLEEFK